MFANEDLRAWLRGRADRPSRHLDFGSYASLVHLDLGVVAIYDPGPPPYPDQVRTMLGLLSESLRRLQEAGFATPAPPDVVL